MDPCCLRCRGALQICRWHSCDCHKRGTEKNLKYDTKTHRDPTADTAIRNLTNQRNRP